MMNELAQRGDRDDDQDVQEGAKEQEGDGTEADQAENRRHALADISVFLGLGGQGKEAEAAPVQRKAGASATGAADEVHRAAKRGIETPTSDLPHSDAIRRSFAGHDLSGVQAHVGGEAESAARAMGAEAFAKGNHVVLPANPSLETTAHEVAHVVQQRSGVQLKGGVGKAGDVYEHEADAAAAAVVRGEPVSASLGGREATTGTDAVQHKLFRWPWGGIGAERIAQLADELVQLLQSDQTAFVARYNQLASELKAKDFHKLRAELRVRRASHDAAAIEADRAKVRGLHASSSYDAMTYHGTHSDMLGGLANTDGQILSAADLHKRGVAQKSGEGDAFRSAGLQDSISVGHGESGFGTSIAYADAVGEVDNYNVQRITWDELKRQIKDVEHIIANFDKIKNNLNGPFSAVRKSKEHFESKLKKLSAELARRKELPSGHPGREGGADNVENYAILFEFDATGLPMKHRSDVKAGGVLGGEASIYAPIDLRRCLRRAYVPVEYVPQATVRLREILGHSQFEVVSLEATDAVPQASQASSSRGATFKNLVDLDRDFQIVQDLYIQSIRTGSVVDPIAYLTARGNK